MYIHTGVHSFRTTVAVYVFSDRHMLCTHRNKFENGHLDNTVSGLYLSNKIYFCMHPNFHVPEFAASPHP